MSSSSDAVAAAAAPFEKPRAVVKKLLAESQPEGQGATIGRSIGRHELRNLDPFLMLDEFSGGRFGSAKGSDTCAAEQGRFSCKKNMLHDP